MECPKCQSADVHIDVPAIAKANVCHHCGWLEMTSVTLEPGMTTYERMRRGDIQRQARTDPSMHTCLMCGKSRVQLNSTGIKLILGISGGICAGCVQLCREVLQQEGINLP